jgi:arginyl-tRNA synthetase
VVIMLGADHHGYIGRMKAMVACFGDDPDDHLEILIGQMVNLVRNGEPLRMSKRAGTVADAGGLRRRAGRGRGPVRAGPVLVRLADRHRHRPVDPGHPGQPGLLRAVRRGPDRERGPQRRRRRPDPGAPDDFRPELLRHEKENELLKALGQYPAVVASAAELREPHRVARYLEELAGAYHRFYDQCRVLPLGDEPINDLQRARLWLNDATRTVIANGLGLLGVSAPERM